MTGAEPWNWSEDPDAFAFAPVKLDGAPKLDGAAKLDEIGSD